VQPRDWRIRIQDILESIDRITGYIEGMDFEEFTNNRVTIEAVSYNLAIIGEATNHIPAEIRLRHPEVPWLRMRGMRNVLIHEYFCINLNILWEAASYRLPPLVPLLQAVLEAEDNLE
jgi:uncharacterized protein with HEPN domain